jgi:hypothetical protein
MAAQVKQGKLGVYRNALPIEGTGNQRQGGFMGPVRRTAIAKKRHAARIRPALSQDAVILRLFLYSFSPSRFDGFPVASPGVSLDR